MEEMLIKLYDNFIEIYTNYLSVGDNNNVSIIEDVKLLKCKNMITATRLSNDDDDDDDDDDNNKSLFKSLDSHQSYITLCYAIKNNRISVVKKILNQLSPDHLRFYMGMLCYACCTSEYGVGLSVITYIISNHQHLIHFNNDMILYEVLIYGRIDMADILYANGCRIINWNNSMLNILILLGNDEVIEWFNEHS